MISLQSTTPESLSGAIFALGGMEDVAVLLLDGQIPRLQTAATIPNGVLAIGKSLHR